MGRGWAFGVFRIGFAVLASVPHGFMPWARDMGLGAERHTHGWQLVRTAPCGHLPETPGSPRLNTEVKLRGKSNTYMRIRINTL
jgi:hypothetical protein